MRKSVCRKRCCASGALAALLVLALPSIHAEQLSLFDGHSLQGWQVEGAAHWSVVDQLIVAEGAGDGFLATDKSYGDFQLMAEFWVDATVNSGIFIRCRDRARIHPETCYELNIFDQHPQQDARTGAIVMRGKPPLAKVDTAGRWNTYEVTAKGASITVKVNGVTTAVLDDADPTSGFIALQHWGEGTVKFRKVEVSAL